ncbi:hypothetical protein SAICODRAFT_7200 [Saitoella complicata NRRL Y-17804]|uniref:uncharacterized protein n=1 Tax=Saitoella complicata (strain BCRC 22490 / CBS 7301 / JCM 7358 / NBRC 10748 / NRRL Y-17804) TaxID=698492 RepID=UPI0008676DC3|nr:uncharacterized protein SAICODRAFT_7200 [Saitoella complicata NRRL Y-17804]ODQ53495.1 hypothetical protein SAICODRAFT_7200 [Saitoella complicata NRRL Y-17804]
MDTYVLFAILSGAFAALSSVFAKLFSNDATVPAILRFLNLEHVAFAEPVVRGLCFLLIFASNAIVTPPSVLSYPTALTFFTQMWTFFSRALALSTSSTAPTIINTVTNFVVAAVSGFAVFGEVGALGRWEWWVGAGMMVVGSVVVGRDGVEDEKEKDKVSDAEDTLVADSAEDVESDEGADDNGKTMGEGEPLLK